MKPSVKIKNILASIFDLSRVTADECISLDKDLEKVRVLIQRAFDFHIFTIFQFDYIERKIIPVHMYGDPYNLVDAVNFKLGKGATGWCVSKKKAIVINNLNRKGTAERYFVNSLLAVQIIINAQLVGAIVMGNSNSDQYSNGDRFFLEMISPVVGTILLKKDFELKNTPAELITEE